MQFKIVRNSARCTDCADEVESTHAHHYAQCRCGAIAVDGGREYQRWIGHPRKLVDTSTYVDPAAPTRTITADEVQALLRAAGTG